LTWQEWRQSLKYNHDYDNCQESERSVR
jgi:hypothetical protein